MASLHAAGNMQEEHIPRTVLDFLIVAAAVEFFLRVVHVVVNMFCRPSEVLSLDLG